MALTITVNGAGTFTASMEEGPVSFSATLGAIGPAGPGVAAGGAEGQILVKASATDYDTEWIDNSARSEFVTARNNTGSAIAKGKVVYLSGATGNKATMALAQADAEGTSARTIGITKAETANNADGDVIISGEITGLDTSAFTAGDVLYLSASTAGGLVTTLPTQPNHGVVIGIVTRSHPSLGSIEVTIQNYQELGELSDVLINSKANLDLLSWDSASSVWKNKTFSTLGLLTSATAASTYQTIAGMSAYAPLASPTFTGTVTIPAGASIAGYLTTLTAANTYLSKSSNLSDLASASTARTNLGLGTMATETASDYLTKAGNLSGLASNATARTNLDVYSKSESDALVPAASTTTAGKVELATDAEAAAGTSTSLAATPSGLTRFGIDPNVASPAITLMTTATSGTGASVGNAFTLNVVAGGPTSAIGYASMRAGVRVSNPGNSYIGAIDFSRPVWISARINRQNGTDANSFGRYTLGKNTGTATFSDPTTNAIGVEFNGTDVYLVTHNGTTLTKTLSSHSSANNVTMHIVVYSDGAGNAKLFINGSEVASNSAAPTTKSATADLNSLQIDVENKQVLTGSTVRLDCANLKVCTA